MDRDPEAERNQIEQDRQRTGDQAELGQGNAHDHSPNGCVDDAVESKLFGGNGELAVDWQHQQRVELAGPNQLGNSGDVDEKESLEELRDHLVSSNEQNHFPFCPIADAIDVAENDGEENDLPDKPKDFHQHPKDEIRLETHLADQRVAKHYGIDLDVTTDHVCLSF